MPLLDLSRTNNKANDSKVAKKSKQSKKVTPIIKGGSGLLDKIASIRQMCDMHLGKYKEEYTVIRDEATLHDYVSATIENGIISIDTETTGLDPLQCDIVGICIYTPNQKSAYIPINHINYITEEKAKNQLSVSVIEAEFRRFIEADVQIVMFNAKFDIRVLRATCNLHNIYCTWDCYLAQKLLNENEEANKLKPLHQKYVLDGKEDAFSFAELFNGVTFNLIPIQTAYLYAAHDSIITYELYEFQHQYIREDSDREDMRDLYNVLMNIEMPCVDAVANMEDNGISFDLEYQKELAEKYHPLLEENLNNFYKLLEKYDKQIEAYRKKQGIDCKLSDTINISSPTQLAILFYDILGYEVVDKKSKRGTGKDILKKWNTDLSNALLDYRAFEKMVNTYIDKMPNCVNSNDGKIHASFNQYGAVTGRFSSQGPNLQNIPSHNKDIRKMFVASPGYVMMSADFSQQEPKALAALCRMQGDSQMYDTFMDGKDLYSEIASKSFNTTYKECLEHFPKGTYIKKKGNKWYYASEDDYDKLADGDTDTYNDGKERRSSAKSILLGVLYGRGETSVGEQLGVSTERASEIKNSVFKGFPAIKKFEADSLDMAYELGYVTTISGRKRRLPALQLDEYEFSWKNGVKQDSDLIDFEAEEDNEIPERVIRRYLTKLHKCRFKDKPKIFAQAKEEGIIIKDNSSKIAEETRECVNARIQGSAADLTKLAMIDLNKNERLKELGFRFLIQIHDEILAECPEENVKECSKLLAETMSKAAEKLLEMPIKTDVDLMYRWYGEKIEYGQIRRLSPGR